MRNDFVFQSPQNPNSHMTVKERSSASYPIRQLLAAGLIRGRVLDFGCGLGADVAYLRDRGHEVVGYDPHYKPSEPEGKFDTVLCTYVLNVLLPEEQTHVLMAVSECLKPVGRAYFSVRRDIRRNGFRLHMMNRALVYQCNVVLPYKSVLSVSHCEIYEYRQFNQTGAGQSGQCPFCVPDSGRELITESATVYAMFDKFPVTKGHALIIPKLHVGNYFDLPDRIKTACWIVVDRVKMLITQRLSPDGFNIGVNINQAGGQTVPHVHIHLIPRYLGDCEDPTGGVRRVIPGQGDYLHQSEADRLN
jgi:ATP adenylyltransferase